MDDLSMVEEKVSHTLTGSGVILAVDDDPSFLGLLRAILEPENFQMMTALRGLQAITLFDKYPPSLILLDIRLPDVDGFTICKHIRETSRVPIIMVSGKVEDQDKAIGLEIGADDFLKKPFLPDELVAKVHAVLRRNANDGSSSHIFRTRDLEIDFGRNKVSLNGQEIEISATEFRIIACLAQNANHVLSIEEILKQVWGSHDNRDNHLVHVNISRLRQKLDDPKGLKYILNRSGLGYMLNQ